MKFALPISLALTLLGCSRESTPVTTVSPTPTPGALTSLSGMVVEPGGACIDNATVEVVRGQAQGQRMMQDSRCDAWAGGGGFLFKDLTPGVEMTIRASAPGWSTEEKTFVAGQQGVNASVLIDLRKL